jgi:uncharacterized membrane protein
MSLHVLPLFQDSDFTLNFAFPPLFPFLWLFGFFQLGMALRTSKTKTLSFLYVLNGMLFLLLAGLEVFTMKEYLSGEWMRNNSLFKFGINAWTLASISAGAMLPLIYDAFAGLAAKVKRESPLARNAFLVAGGALVFCLFQVLLYPALSLVLGQQESGMGGVLAHMILILDFVAVAALLGWLLIRRPIPIWATLIFSLASLVLLVPPLIPSVEFGSLLAIIKKWGTDFEGSFLFPALVAAGVVLGFAYLEERRKNAGVNFAFLSWNGLWVFLLALTLVYPAFATWRKCHGFFEQNRRQSVGYTESPTLNGLAFLSQPQSYPFNNKNGYMDGAAIRFLNERVPGQPCLVEFVGAGYNTWGSRFSIFTGIPALMGWDGHVREWLTGQPGMDTIIAQRRSATETIYTTTDIGLAKKTLDAYGVRLVVVGSVERLGVPGQSAGYPQAGLDKFSQFLPLIYKNPGVEIYYNPPPARN